MKSNDFKDSIRSDLIYLAEQMGESEIANGLKSGEIPVYEALKQIEEEFINRVRCSKKYHHEEARAKKNFQYYKMWQQNITPIK
jgi:hypothetical protein